MPYVTRRAMLFTLALASLWPIEMPALAQTQNLVQNPGFETGDFTAWDTSQIHSATHVVASGSVGYLAHSGDFFAALGAVTNPDTFSQSIATTTGQAYSVSFWLASNGTTPNLFDASFGSTTLLDVTNLGAQNYTLYSTTVIASSSSTLLSFTSRDDPSYLALDDVSVTQTSTAGVPEANTLLMALLGLVPGTMLLRRRHWK